MMKSIFFAGLVLFTQVASASDGVVCIANDAGNDVRWTIRDSQGELLRTRDQRSENRWRCQRGDFPKAAVTVRVSLKKDQYSAPSCYAQIFGNEWVVTTQKGSQIQCEVRNESGVQTSRVEYKSILKAERIRLFGEASFGQAINGGNARLVDRDGTVFGSAPVGSDGVFAIPLQSLPEDERPLFVEIDGIKEVPGKLTASVPQDFDYSIDNLGVNLATTLAVKSGDEDAVKQYLELKSFQDLGIALTHAPQTLFPSEAIAAKARKERSLDGVIDNMIRDMRDGQVVSQSFAAVATAAAPRLKAAVPVPSEHEIGDALVKLVDNPAFTAALTAAGWKSESQRTAESLEEIKRQLTVITSMLHQVLAEQAYAAYNVSMGELNPIMVRIDQSLDRYGILMNRWPNIVDANGNVRPGKQSDHKNQLNDIADLRKRIKDDTGFRSFIGDSLSRMTGKNLEGGTTQIGDNDAMQRIYAIYLLNQPEYRAIDKRFYQELDRHLLRFKAYQAKTVLLFALAYADPKASMVEVQRADYTKASFLMMNVYYPKTAEGEFFSMLGGGSMLGEAVRAGRFIYDRDGATLWSSVPLVTSKNKNFEVFKAPWLRNILPNQPTSQYTQAIAKTKKSEGYFACWNVVADIADYKGLATSVGRGLDQKGNSVTYSNFGDALIGHGFKFPGGKPTVLLDGDKVGWSSLSQWPWQAYRIDAALLTNEANNPFYTFMYYSMPIGGNYAWAKKMESPEVKYGPTRRGQCGN